MRLLEKRTEFEKLHRPNHKISVKCDDHFCLSSPLNPSLVIFCDSMLTSFSFFFTERPRDGGAFPGGSFPERV